MAAVVAMAVTTVVPGTARIASAQPAPQTAPQGQPPAPGQPCPDGDAMCAHTNAQAAPQVLVEKRDDGAVIVAHGLPAVSADGQQIAYLATWSGYDEPYTAELNIVNVTGRRQRLILENRMRDASGEIKPPSAAALRKRATKAQTLLQTGQFASLSPVEPPAEVEESSEGIITLQSLGAHVVSAGTWRFSYNEEKRIIAVFDKTSHKLISRIIGMKRNWGCCGGASADDPGCTVGYSYVRAWTGDSALFIMGKNIAGPDGCELDEQYLTIWPKQRKSQLGTNKP